MKHKKDDPLCVNPECQKTGPYPGLQSVVADIFSTGGPGLFVKNLLAEIQKPEHDIHRTGYSIFLAMMLRGDEADFSLQKTITMVANNACPDSIRPQLKLVMGIACGLLLSRVNASAEHLTDEISSNLKSDGVYPVHLEVLIDSYQQEVKVQKAKATDTADVMAVNMNSLPKDLMDQLKQHLVPVAQSPLADMLTGTEVELPKPTVH